MKKFIAIAVLVSIVAFGAAAQGRTNMDNGDLAASVGLNFGWGFGVSGGVEMMLARWDLADVIPLTFGAAVKAGADLWPGFELTVAGLGTMHFGLATFDVPDWAKKFDWYTGLGLGIGIGDGFGIGIASGGGVSYHFTPTIAVLAESFWAAHFNKSSHGMSTIGVQFKL